jgi:anti-anti-sigma factor
MSEVAAFQARCERRGAGVLVVVHGEIDLNSAERLREVLNSPEARAPVVVLDLRAVTFIDSGGLSLVVREHQRARAQRFRFAVAVGGAPAVRRLFELAGLVDALDLVEAPATVLG